MLIHEIELSGMNYDAFRDFHVTEDILVMANRRVQHLLKKHQELKDTTYFDSIGFITFSMLAKNYNVIKYGLVDEETFLRGITAIADKPSFNELYGYYQSILSEQLYFPIPELVTKEANVSYSNSWFSLRSYGGSRRHEGTDLMASNNIRGFFPIISMTDGIVEKLGWLEKGGYRIGIRTPLGSYFYYAHLHSYAPELKVGDKVIAGQLIGFMGDSGYGSEGTIGQFDVHLHLGVYVKTSLGEMSVNPYWLLKMLEKNKIQYINE